MRFAVTRTSVYDDDQPPCPEAIKGTMPRWDARTFTSFEEFETKLGESFTAKGTDHQVIYGPRGGVQGIKRRMEDRTAWFVDFALLPDLLAFYEKYGPLVIEGAFGNGDQPAIEIYDDYRE